ncbi:MAG: hypothetical protein AAGC95_08115 [Pseudomonadota bacterium]
MFLLGVPAVEVVLADIGCIPQRDLDLLITKRPTGPLHDAPFVEAFLDLPYAEWPAFPITVDVKPEDQADDLCLFGVNFQTLLDFLAAFLGGVGAKPKRRHRAVPEALFGVGDHRTAHMFRRFFALILIHGAEHCADDAGLIALADVLGDGDKLNAIAFQLVRVLEEVKRIPGEARLGMHDNNIEGRMAGACLRDHGLELQPVICRGAGAGVDECLRDLPVAGFAIIPASLDLVRNREVMRRLFAG